MLNRFGSVIYTKLFGHYVGSDIYQNKYYKRLNLPKEKRWVIYNGINDASKVPAEWHGWLHFISDHPPAEHCADMWAPNNTGVPGTDTPVTISAIPLTNINTPYAWRPCNKDTPL